MKLWLSKITRNITKKLTHHNLQFFEAVSGWIQIDFHRKILYPRFIDLWPRRIGDTPPYIIFNFAFMSLRGNLSFLKFDGIESLEVQTQRLEVRGKRPHLWLYSPLQRPCTWSVGLWMNRASWLRGSSSASECRCAHLQAGKFCTGAQLLFCSISTLCLWNMKHDYFLEPFNLPYKTHGLRASFKNEDPITNEISIDAVLRAGAKHKDLILEITITWPLRSSMKWIQVI